MVPLHAQSGPERESEALRPVKSKEGECIARDDGRHGSAVRLHEHRDALGDVHRVAHAATEAVDRKVDRAGFTLLVRRTGESDLTIAVHHEPPEELVSELRGHPWGRRGDLAKLA